LGHAVTEHTGEQQYEYHYIGHDFIPNDTPKLRSNDGKSMVKTVYLYALLNGLP